jgi:hypothetical protein
MRALSTGPKDRGVDPFKHTITIASACNLIFRCNFLVKNKILILLPRGYDAHEKQSRKGIMWLNYVSCTEGIHIRHAQNGRELKIGKFKMDGYCEAKQMVYEFNGCFWHGCPKCYKPETVHHLHQIPMHELYTSILEKKVKIKVENSGILQWCKNEADIEKFIREYEEKEGIVLEREKIVRNQGSER